MEQVYENQIAEVEARIYFRVGSLTAWQWQDCGGVSTGLPDLFVNRGGRNSVGRSRGQPKVWGVFLDKQGKASTLATMPRKVRVEYPGAIYHVMSRGDRSEDIFLDEVEREDFLKPLAEACPKAGFQVTGH